MHVSKEIRFLPGKILIKPNVEKKIMDMHKMFLKTRIDDALSKSDGKLEPLQNRLRSFTSSNLNIYIPDSLKRNKKFMRELDYSLRFMSNLRKNQTKILVY